MRYGFYLPTRGQTASPEALETLVTRAEALGFSSVVIADHTSCSRSRSRPSIRTR
jgi:alkanesulfonate monooxygenase SsuD/methylene tetrahydromethanopterin reductase-like flavin-dependent oxidoreductase (luciferase family)